MTRVLLTGFEPFADAPNNSSWDAVTLLAQTWAFDAELVIRELPVAFGTAGRRLLEHVAMHTPDAVVAVGVAQGRAAITPERIAVNLRDARIPDNKGRQLVEAPVSASGPAAYFSTLPVTEIVAALHDHHIAAEASLTAGTYVCNDTFYALQHGLAGLGVASGLIHVPAAPQMQLDHSIPTMSIGEIARGIGIAIEVTLAHLGGST